MWRFREDTEMGRELWVPSLGRDLLFVSPRVRSVETGARREINQLLLLGRWKRMREESVCLILIEVSVDSNTF